jgi:dTDP-4-dehydrorhamnose 3,5-epimerase
VGINLIDGVIIKKLSEFTDERGWLCEFYRNDSENFQNAMAYASYTNFNAIRGPHEHIKQADFFVFIGPGDFELYLWDNRKDSPTYDKHEKIVVGASNKVSVLVPPGVVHGYKSISKQGSISLNLPDKLYKGKDKQEEVDEIRHENNPDSKFEIK